MVGVEEGPDSVEEWTYSVEGVVAEGRRSERRKSMGCWRVEVDVA